MRSSSSSSLTWIQGKQAPICLQLQPLVFNDEGALKETMKTVVANGVSRKWKIHSFDALSEVVLGSVMQRLLEASSCASPVGPHERVQTSLWRIGTC